MVELTIPQNKTLQQDGGVFHGMKRGVLLMNIGTPDEPSVESVSEKIFLGRLFVRY